MKGRVFVAGTGVITAIGNTVRENVQSLHEMKSGIGPITMLDTIHCDTLPAGEVKQSNANLADALHSGNNIPRTALLGIHAAKEAIDSLSFDIKKYKTGLISATTVGGMDLSEKFLVSFFDNNQNGRLHDIQHHECGKITELIADYFGINELVTTINTACSSSLNAIMLGTRLIRQGYLDVAIAGGADALTKFTLNGFNSLMILDSAPCRPFDATRAGLNLGEGAGFVVLVSEEVAHNESIRSLCHVAGFGNATDAYHQTASSPEGQGSYLAMQEAVFQSNLDIREIDYINAHGTGTINNDASEGKAVQRLFGDSVPMISSTKAYTGHTLGASGVIESVYSILSLSEQCVYPNLRYQNKMPEVAFEPVVQLKTGVTLRNVLSNSFGFGGNCSSVIFSRS